MGFDIETIFDLGKIEINKTLNVDKIKDIDDIKRVLKFLNINVTISEDVEPNGFKDVEDLFE